MLTAANKTEMTPRIFDRWYISNGYIDLCEVPVLLLLSPYCLAVHRLENGGTDGRMVHMRCRLSDNIYVVKQRRILLSLTLIYTILGHQEEAREYEWCNH